VDRPCYAIADVGPDAWQGAGGASDRQDAYDAVLPVAVERMGLTKTPVHLRAHRWGVRVARC
ncbi:MAG: hypothetical protein ACO3FL_08135, partial [Ilumatobacteraceae bacterium]